MIIRTAQMETLDLQMNAPFIARVIEHLKTHEPDAVRDLTDEMLRDRVYRGIKRAQFHNLTDAATVICFVTLLFVIGPGFDRQPNIQEILDTPDLPSRYRTYLLTRLPTEQDWEEAQRVPLTWENFSVQSGSE